MMTATFTIPRLDAGWLTAMESSRLVNRSDGFSTKHVSRMSDTQETVSAALLNRLAERDATALASAYDEFGRTVYAVAYRVVGQSSDAEEAVQDAFRALWQNAGKLSSRQAKVLPWLITTSRRAAIDILRRRKSRIPSAAGISKDELEIENRVSVNEPTAGDALQQKEAAEKVRDAVDTLPSEQKQMVRLAFFSGLTHQEISARLSVPLGTVKSRLRYGLQKLQQKIGEIRHD
jgi:RNA polymerase sigma-70 factor (ECF subfamily)